MTVNDVFLYQQAVPGTSDVQLNAACGSDDPNDIRLYAYGANDIKLYATRSAVRLSQQYLEAWHSGLNNQARVSSLYLEVWIPFGIAPPKKPPKKPPPGQNKDEYFARRKVLERRVGSRFHTRGVVSLIYPEFIAASRPRVITVDVPRVIYRS